VSKEAKLHNFILHRTVGWWILRK